MARPNKAQHKIPRIYLEAFTDSSGLLWVGDKGFNLFSRKPSHVLTEKDYYTIRFKTGGGTLNIETKYLGGIEGAYSRVYRNKIAKRLPIDLHDKAILAIFLASIVERQPGRRQSLEKFFNDVREITEHMRNLPEASKKAMASLPHSSGPSIPADDLLKMGEDIGSLHTALIPEGVKDIAHIVFDMKWAFMVRPKNCVPFITSDNPAVMVNPVAEAKWGVGKIVSSPGLGQKDVELSLPLSSDIALICGWLMTMDCMYVPVTEKEVLDMNRRIKRHARTIICSDKKILGEMIENVRAYKEKKAKDELNKIRNET